MPGVSIGRVTRLADRNGHKRLDGPNLSVIPPGESSDRLDNFAPQSQSEQAGPLFAELAAGSKVVDLGHVAGRPQQKADRQVGILIMSAQGLPKVVDVVRRESAPAHDGQVAGEVDEQPEQLAARRSGRQHTDVRVDGTSGLDDLRIPLARMGGLPAVAHQEAAVEADARLVAECRRPARRHEASGRPK